VKAILKHKKCFIDFYGRLNRTNNKCAEPAPAGGKLLIAKFTMAASAYRKYNISAISQLQLTLRLHFSNKMYVFVVNEYN